MSDIITNLTGYTIKASDYNGFYRAYLRRNYLALSRFLSTLSYAALLIAISVALKHSHRPDLADIIIIGVLAVSVCYIVVPVVTYIQGMMQFAFGKAVKVQHNLGITSDGVTKSSPLATVSVPWTTLYALDETRGTILFFTNRRCAIILPKSAFASPSDAQGFLAVARNYLDQAKAKAG